MQKPGLMKNVSQQHSSGDLLGCEQAAIHQLDVSEVEMEWLTDDGVFERDTKGSAPVRESARDGSSFGVQDEVRADVRGVGRTVVVGTESFAE